MSTLPRQPSETQDQYDARIRTWPSETQEQYNARIARPGPYATPEQYAGRVKTGLANINSEFEKLSVDLTDIRQTDMPTTAKYRTLVDKLHEDLGLLHRKLTDLEKINPPVW